MAEPVIVNRTDKRPPQRPSTLAVACQHIEALAKGFAALVKRVAAVEARAPQPGKDGVGLSDALLDHAGHLVLTLTDGRTLNLGRVVGKDGESPEPPKFDPPQPGKDGVGLSDALLDHAGHLVLTLTDGRTLNLGRVVGKDGESPEPPKFDPPQPGKPGRSISSAVVSELGHLILTFDDDTEIDAGLVAKEGKPGDSVKGDPGRGIAKAEISGTSLVLHMTDGSKQTVGRVVGKDGEPGRGVVPEPAPSIEIADIGLAAITARDLDRLRVREITVNGQTFQFLSLN